MTKIRVVLNGEVRKITIRVVGIEHERTISTFFLGESSSLIFSCLVNPLGAPLRPPLIRWGIHGVTRTVQRGLRMRAAILAS